MDFILVPDSLTANEVRKQLAEQSCHGVMVGNFSRLLEVLTQLWVHPTPGDFWADKLQDNILKSKQAFWANSIQVDEHSVRQQLDASLQFMLNGLPLNQPLQALNSSTIPNALSQKAQDYYNDLVALHQDMDQVRPIEQMLAQQWLANMEAPALDTLALHYDAQSFCFEYWQAEVVTALAKLNPPQSIFKNMIESVLQQVQQIDFADTSTLEGSDYSAMAKRLLDNQLAENETAKPLPKPAELVGVICRDALLECEVVASMVQNLQQQGTACTDISVVYPSNSDYAIWLKKQFEASGILASNLSDTKRVVDWQAHLLRDLLVLQNPLSPPMARKSVLCNPLMPWGTAKSRIQLIEKDFTDVETLANKISEGLLAILAEKQNSVAGLVTWLETIASHLKALPQSGLTHESMQQKIAQLASTLAQYQDEGFEQALQKSLNQLQPGNISLGGTKQHLLDSVVVLDDQEHLPKKVKHLIVVGFNQPHYAYPIHTGVKQTALNAKAWQGLSFETDLLFQLNEKSQFKQKQLADTFAKTTHSLTLLSSQQGFNGSALPLSDLALDLALCFEEPSKVNSHALFEPLESIQHPFIEQVETSLSPKVDDKLNKHFFNFNQDLLRLHKDYDGNPRAESPSSFENMMVSPLAWLLDRQGLTKKGWEVETLDIMLQGTIAHKVFELYEQSAQPKQPAYSASLFDDFFAQAVQEDAPFLQNPSWKLEVSQLSQQVRPAFKAFVDWLKAENWQLVDSEERLKGTLWDIPVKGFADAVLEKNNRTFILDYKKSSSTSRLKRLEQGLDLQTYIYRTLYLQKPTDNPPQGMVTGYYNLNDQVMVVDDMTHVGQPMQGVELNVQAPNQPPGQPVDDQSSVAIRHIKARLKQLQAGLILANTTQDAERWKKVGITAYALENNSVIQRSLVAVDEVANLNAEPAVKTLLEVHQELMNSLEPAPKEQK